MKKFLRSLAPVDEVVGETMCTEQVTTGDRCFRKVKKEHDAK